MAADLIIYRDAAGAERDDLHYTNGIGAMIGAASILESGLTQGREYTLTYQAAGTLMTVETVDEHANTTSWAVVVAPLGTYDETLVPGVSITLGAALNDGDNSTMYTGRAFEDSGAAGIIQAGNNSVTESYYVKNEGADVAMACHMRVYPKATFANTVNAPILAVREMSQALVADVINMTVSAANPGPLYDFDVTSGGGLFAPFTIVDVTPGAWTEIITGLEFKCDDPMLVNDEGDITMHVGPAQVELAVDNAGVPGTWTSAGQLGLSSPGETDLRIDPAETIRCWARVVTDETDGTADNRRMFELRADYCYTT